MMNGYPIPFIVTLILCAIIIPMLAIGVSKEVDQFSEQCHARGGVGIAGRNKWYCVKADVVLDKR